jgi:RNA polymerase sigma factor (TIGR02999 family)
MWRNTAEGCQFWCVRSRRSDDMRPETYYARGMSGVTQILSRIDQGDSGAASELLPLVYDELRRVAAQKMAQEQPGLTLQATALVHEAYLRLVGGVGEQPWNSRGHFFAAAAEAMRRILVERARRKHRGDAINALLAERILAAPTPLPADEVLTVDEALSRLTQVLNRFRDLADGETRSA